MTVYFRESSATGSATPSPTAVTSNQLTSSTEGESPAGEPAEDEKAVTIEMKHQRSETILGEFMRKTGAVPVVPTAAEQAEMQTIKERTERAKIDRQEMSTYLTAKRREAAVLAQARSEAAAIKNAT